MSGHERGTVNELGYDRAICVECEVTWPCVDSVKEACERLDLANGLPCNCGWHEATDENVAQDPEREKVTPAPAVVSGEKHEVAPSDEKEGRP